MKSVVCLTLAIGLLTGATGCCANPYRFYQNAYGFCNPEVDQYRRGPAPPVTTPPGYEVTAVPKK